MSILSAYSALIWTPGINIRCGDKPQEKKKFFLFHKKQRLYKMWDLKSPESYTSYLRLKRLRACIKMCTVGRIWPAGFSFVSPDL
jgi:hypothetical protein